MSGYFTAENRQDPDIRFFRLFDERVPAGEVPFARLRLDLRPVEVGADEADSGFRDSGEFAFRLQFRHAVQVGADSVRRLRAAEREGGREKQGCHGYALHFTRNSGVAPAARK